MRTWVAAVFLNCWVIGAGQAPTAAVVIDGRLADSFWAAAKFSALAPERGGEVAARIAGRYLYLAARLPEQGGRYTARSIGVNPRWEEEDAVSFFIRIGNENDWRLTIGPLGAYSVEWRWTGEPDWYTASPEKRQGVLAAAVAGQTEWSAEAAIPLANLGSPVAGAVSVSAERVRAARQGVPELRWRWPSVAPMVAAPGTPSAAAPDPLFLQPAIGNREPPIEAARVEHVPPADSGWSDAPWNRTAVWRLSRDEPQARAPEFATEVKLLHDSEKLAVLARGAAPDAAGESDAFQVYLALSGSSYVRHSIDASGSLEGALGFSGGPRISRPRTDWKSPARGAALRGKGEWTARLDLPLGFIAEALGETAGAREWRILLLRSRGEHAGEPREISVLPVIESPTALCPARYRRLALMDGATKQQGSPAPAAKSNLAFAPTRVFSTQQRAKLNVSAMLDTSIRNRVLAILRSERREWDRVQTLADWESFRNRRIGALDRMIGEFPRELLEVRVIKEFRGDGYRRQDLVYRTRRDFWVTANLYLPTETRGRVPGIVIAHSLHGPKSQFELQDMGILWARAGCAVLVIDQAGYGERREGHPWDREAYHSRYVSGMQLDLIGESLIKWMVWDLMRGIDLLTQRSDVDPEKIVLLGAVAGGGDPAAVTAALDRRLAAVAPFNFGESTPEIPRFIPEKNQWPLELADPGLYDWDTTRCLRRGIVDQFLQWTICASLAPRRLVYAYELGWNVEDLPAWARYQKVFGFYGARENLAEAHGFGPFPGPGECWNIGPAQRRSLYPSLERWFGIPIPFEEMKSTPRANLQREPRDRRPEAELAVLDAPAAAQLRMRSMHDAAHELATEKLARARSTLAGMSAPERRDWLRAELKKRLGDIEPNRHAPAAVNWTKRLPDAEVEAIALTVEPDVLVPLLLFRPEERGGKHPPVVVALAEGGKDLFLATRAREIEALLRAGVAVCLPDVRGTGETTPDNRRDPDSQEAMLSVVEQMLGETLAGRRLKDVRTVLAYLGTRMDLNSKRIALWGESLAPANPEHFVSDELPHWQVGPEIKHQGEPLGGLLALLGALYEPGVRAVAVSGGLVSYLSILEESFAYVPADATVPGFLEAGDLADVAGALAPVPILIEACVDARNRVIPEKRLGAVLQRLVNAYRDSPATLSLQAERRALEPVNWLLKHL